MTTLVYLVHNFHYKLKNGGIVKLVYRVVSSTMLFPLTVERPKLHMARARVGLGISLSCPVVFFFLLNNQ